jgi:putative membrane protein
MFKPLLAGICIGLANLVPGISGASVAVITNQYARIMSQCDAILNRQFKSLDVGYLIGIIGGAVLGLLIFSNPLYFIMIHYEAVALMAIGGLVFGSIKAVKIAAQPKPLVSQLMHPLFIAGVAVLIACITLNGNHGAVVSTEVPVLVLFFSGLVAMVAMLIPGISGSLFLVVMGVYTPILNGIKTMSLSIFLPFALGAAVGGIGTVKLVQWALKNKPHDCQGLVSGLLVGSVVFMIVSAGNIGWLGFGIFFGMALLSWGVFRVKR